MPLRLGPTSTLDQTEKAPSGTDPAPASSRLQTELCCFLSLCPASPVCAQTRSPAEAPDVSTRPPTFLASSVARRLPRARIHAGAAPSSAAAGPPWSTRSAAGLREPRCSGVLGTVRASRPGACPQSRWLGGSVRVLLSREVALLPVVTGPSAP